MDIEIIPLYATKIFFYMMGGRKLRGQVLICKIKVVLKAHTRDKQKFQEFPKAALGGGWR